MTIRKPYRTLVLVSYGLAGRLTYEIVERTYWARCEEEVYAEIRHDCRRYITYDVCSIERVKPYGATLRERLGMMTP